MKKFLCIFTALCLLCLGMTMAVYADNEVIVSADATVECYPGDTDVAVTFSVDENPGFASLLIIASYDNTKITPAEDGVEKSNAFSSTAAITTNTMQEGIDLESLNFVRMFYRNPGNITSTGDFVTLYFDVADDVPIGTEIPIVLTTEAENNTDEEYQEVPVSLVNGKITVKGDIENYTFEDDEVVYDGTAKTIEVTDLPQGVTASYTYEKLNGATSEYEEVQSCVDVGTYKVTASMTGDAYFPAEDEATLVITPAAITGYSFEDVETTFDGTAKDIEVTVGQDATAGVSIAYTCDGEPFAGATNVGEYEVTATITKDNYTPEVLTATLTIDEADIEGYTFEDDTVTYDETAKTIEVTVGQDATAGVSIAYTCDGEPFDGATDVGEYEVTATITKAGYSDLVLTATLTIEEADIEGYTFEDDTVTYDETAKTFEVTAAQDATAGVSIVYTCDGEPFVSATEPGEYEVTATITKANYNDLVLTATLTIEEADIEGYTFEDDELVYDTTSQTIEVTAAQDATAGVSIAYTSNGEAFTGAVDAGSYPVTATITKAGYNDLVLTATLVITPAPGVQNPAYISSTTYPNTNSVATVEGDEVTGDIDLTGTGFSFVDDEAPLAIGDNTVYVNYTSSDPNYYDVINAAKVVTLASRNILDVYDLRLAGDTSQWYSVDADNDSEAKYMEGVKYYINDVEQDNLPDGVTVQYSLDGETYDDDLVIYEGGTYLGYAKITADGFDDAELTATFRLNYLVGDTYTDSLIDTRDASKMAQSIAGWTGLDFTITQDKAGKRVTEPLNRLTGADVVKVLQYIAGWQNIVFGEAD